MKLDSHRMRMRRMAGKHAIIVFSEKKSFADALVHFIDAVDRIAGNNQ